MPAGLLNGTHMLKLIKLLADGQFHSGEELGAAMGVSRSAIWKQLRGLEAEYGLELHSVKGRGYRLEAAIEALKVPESCNGCDPSWTVFVHDSVDSTNAQALRMIVEGYQAPFAVAAEMQLAGRGRRGRRWVSPFGQNIYYSLVLRIERGARQLEGLSLVVGLAVLAALEGEGVSGAGLKWPNDVLVSDKKIAGILLELAGDLADVCHVVIGVGINVNMLRPPEAIDQDWTSLRAELSRVIDRSVLLASLQRWLDLYLGRLEASGFAALRDEWQARHLWQGKVVSLTAGAHVTTGLALGVDEVGALRVQVGAVEQRFSGGELSLRLGDDS